MGVATKAVRLGERTVGNNPEIIAIVPALYAHQRLRGSALQILYGEQDCQRTIFAIRKVEHGSPDSALPVCVRCEFATGGFDVRVEALEEIVRRLAYCISVAAVRTLKDNSGIIAFPCTVLAIRLVGPESGILIW